MRRFLFLSILVGVLALPHRALSQYNYPVPSSVTFQWNASIRGYADVSDAWSWESWGSDAEQEPIWRPWEDLIYSPPKSVREIAQEVDERSAADSRNECPIISRSATQAVTAIEELMESFRAPPIPTAKQTVSVQWTASCPGLFDVNDTWTLETAPTSSEPPDLSHFWLRPMFPLQYDGPPRQHKMFWVAGAFR